MFQKSSPVVVHSIPALALLFLSGGALFAQCPTPVEGPDLVPSEIPGASAWGTIDGVTAYTYSTDACNMGDTPIPFNASSAQHPVIASHLYRYDKGRFEQIGLSWVKHTFGSANANTCCICDNPGTIAFMGPGCSDLYCAQTNGAQFRLGPRSEVNAYTGEFLYPYTAQGQTGGITYKRIQVLHDDMDPDLYPDAKYFAEVQYVDPTDAAAGNADNNVSYRECYPYELTSNGWSIAMTGPTRRGIPALAAWGRIDPAVSFNTIQLPDDGLMNLAYRATDNEDGTWHYEYAIHNQNSHRGASSFELIMSKLVNVNNVEFNDINYHSGEVLDNGDWAMDRADDGMLRWIGESFVANGNANALRWGTTYNFAFDANTEPEMGEGKIGLFRPGTPSTLTVSLLVPKRPCLVDQECFANCEVVYGDYLWFNFCFYGPIDWYHRVCACNDVNDDSNIDLRDFAHLQNEYTGP